MTLDGNEWQWKLDRIDFIKLLVKQIKPIVVIVSVSLVTFVKNVTLL
jgi:hypothetical protein